MSKLHVEIRKTGYRQYEGVCLENCVAASGPNPERVERKLNHMLDDFTEHASHSVKVPFYWLRLLRWHVGFWRQDGRREFKRRDVVLREWPAA